MMMMMTVVVDAELRAILLHSQIHVLDIVCVLLELIWSRGWCSVVTEGKDTAGREEGRERTKVRRLIFIDELLVK